MADAERERAHVVVATPSDPPTRQLSMVSATSTSTSTPMSSAPPTPRLETRRRPSHPATSPLLHPNSPREHHLRRASSAMSLGNARPGSSHSTPKLARQGSRQSPGTPRGEDGGGGSHGGSRGGSREAADKRPTPKRSISNLIANLREAQTTMESIEEPVPLTAAGIAIEHFARELLSHHDEASEAETVVILHDACYGHRFSRLKTSKGSLSMIVERPERIHASVLGASAAYVRLGGHHAGGRHAPHPQRKIATQPPFKIRRTGRSIDITSSYVTSVHGTAWMGELKELCSKASERLAAGDQELSRASTPNDAAPEKRRLHEGDLYLAPESLEAFQGALGGVADAVDSVFHSTSLTRRAFVAIRPPGHHCSADYPSGFCWLNNVHVGIEYAAQTYGLTHAVILDFDLHHGDGSQQITWERNRRNNEKRLNAQYGPKLKGGPKGLEPDIGYFSLHDINSYPCEMGDDEKVQAASLCIDNAHNQAIFNVHLQPWKTEDEFWALYETRYRVLLEKARLFLRLATQRIKGEGKQASKAAVFISAGFDASEWEGAGMQRHKVNVPTDFYARFTREVVEMAQEAGLGCDGRVVSVLEGGYSDRALCSGVLSHLSGLCGTASGEKPNGEAKKGPGNSLDELMGGLKLNGASHSSSALHYDRSWWSAANLTVLEHKINPPPPPGPGKKVRTGPQPTYATPTESFAYKVVDPNKFARSISGTMREAPVPVRPATPPPPEVDWVVATQELSKLLIPVDRQTRSCTAEELGGVRAKKDRLSAAAPGAGIEVEGMGRRQLRERKGKVTALYAGSAHSDELESVRSVSRTSTQRDSSRRQTLHEFPTPSVELPAEVVRKESRRLSAGSALSSLGGLVEEQELRAAVPAGLAGAERGMSPPPAPAPLAGDLAGMQVKKTRAPGKLRGNGLSVPGAARTQQTVATSAPVSPAYSGGFATSGRVPPPVPPPPRNVSSVPSAPNGTAAAHAGDLASLTSGMKKITLKGPGSREDHDRKMADKLAAERRARALKGAETRRVNAAAKKAALAAQGGVAPHEAAQRAINAARDMKRAAKAPPLRAEGQAGHPSGILMGGGRREAEPQGVSGPGPVLFDRMMGMVEDTAEGKFGMQEAVGAPGANEEDHVEAGAVSAGTESVKGMPPAANEANVSSAAAAAATAVEMEVEAHGQPSSPATVRKAPPSLLPDNAARQLLHENNLAEGISPRSTSFSTNGNYGSSPPTTRSPKTARQARPLPTWNSTGPIPFSPAPAPSSPTYSKTGVTSPKSPRKYQQLPRPESVGDGNGVSRTMLGGQAERVISGLTPEREVEQVETMQGVFGREEGGGVWDVPETPQK